MDASGKRELVKLLELKAQSPFQRRKRRLLAAEARVFGRAEGSARPSLTGLGDLLHKARNGDVSSFTADELLIVNFGATQEEVAAYYQERKAKERT